MNQDEVVQLAGESGAQLVTFMYCDNAGVIRDKSAYMDSLKWRRDSGVGFSATLQATMVGDNQLVYREAILKDKLRGNS